MKEILITSSFLIVALVLLRCAFAKKVSRRLIYGMWLLVALRLLIPVQIGQMEISVLSNTQPLSDTMAEISDIRVAGQTQDQAHKKVIASYIEHDLTVFTPQMQEQIREELKGGNSAQDVANQLGNIYDDTEIFAEHMRPEIQQIVEQSTNAITFGQIVTVIWLIGVVVMLFWFLVVNLRHHRRIRAHAQKLETDSPIPVYVSEQVGSPCLVGLIRPSVYMSPACACDAKLLRHVLAHELTHYAHWDHVWSLVRCLCLCIYWFDPLVWFAAFLSCRDCELACDEGALKRLGEEERYSYGEALLAVVDHDSSHKRLLKTATTMNETKQQLKERVCFIVKKRKISLIAAICMILICTIVAGCAAAGVDNGHAGMDAGIQSSTPATHTTVVPTTDPIPTATTQPEPVRMDVPGPEWSVPLTVEMQDAINEAIYEKFGHKSDLTWDEDSYWCIRYYGSYDGHIVYFIESPMDVVTEIVLGDQTIRHWNDCTIWVYTAGELCTLEEAYSNGLLTDEHISLINQYHKEYNKAYREWLLSQYGE